MNRLKQTLDREFSIYIRNRDTPGRCISCGRQITFQSSDAGHYIPRIHNSTRWDERNVNAQCIECNRHKYGNIPGYEKGLTMKYGPWIIEELKTLKNIMTKVSRSDLTERIIYYRNKSKALQK